MIVEINSAKEVIFSEEYVIFIPNDVFHLITKIVANG